MTDRGTHKRFIDEHIWTHPWFQKLTMSAQHLYIYLFSNKHDNPSGIYKISSETMAFESKVPIDDLPKVLKLLEKNVSWWPEFELVWHKEMLNEQCGNESILKGVEKFLEYIYLKHPEIVKEFLEYNKGLYEKYSIEMPFQELKTKSETEPEKEKPGKQKHSFEEYVEQLRAEYPELDFDNELKKFHLYWSEDKRQLKRPKSALKNWMDKARKFKEKDSGASRKHIRQIPQRYTPPENI